MLVPTLSLSAAACFKLPELRGLTTGRLFLGPNRNDSTRFDNPFRATLAARPRSLFCTSPRCPTRGCPSNPQTLATIIREAGIKTTLLSTEELADPTTFHAGRFDLLVVPTGQTFPAIARRNFIEFLRQGGAFVATGGYAFNDLVRKVDGRWRPEVDVVREARRQAMSREASHLPDGGFEQTAELPLGGVATDGTWRRSGVPGRISTFEPHQGNQSIEVDVPRGGTGAQCYLNTVPVAGTTYEVSGWMRTKGLIGEGMAYMAVYQFDADDQLVEFRDFAVVREEKDWHQHSYSFTPGPTVEAAQSPIRTLRLQRNCLVRRFPPR